LIDDEKASLWMVARSGSRAPREFLDFYKMTWDKFDFDRAWAAFQRDERVHALGAKISGRLVGIAQFLEHASTTGSDVCYLRDLFTDPADRGQGVATALINAVVDAARANRCSRVYWVTHESNLTARTAASSDTRSRCDL
jgi:GNAT superfamily N-acetyltransferase